MTLLITPSDASGLNFHGIVSNPYPLIFFIMHTKICKTFFKMGEISCGLNSLATKGTKNLGDEAVQITGAGGNGYIVQTSRHALHNTIDGNYDFTLLLLKFIL